MRGVTLSSVDGDVISSDTDLTPPQLEAVFMAIKSGRKLKVLRLRGADLRSVQIESLVGALSRLEEVDFTWAKLTPQQVAAVNSIPGHCRIKGL